MNDRLTRLQKELEAIPNPQDRAKAVTDVLRDLPELQEALRVVRQQDLARMHTDDGMSFGQLGALLGITRGRVKQIVDGQRVSGRYLKKATDEAAEDEKPA